MKLTASKVGLARACGYWLTPGVEVAETEMSAAAVEGTRVHKLIEEDIGRPLEGEEVDPAVATARRYVARHIGNRPMDREAAYGWDGVRADFIGHGREAYAGREDLVVAGTVDLVAMMGRRQWRVVDWKNGERGAEHASEQLRALAALVLDTTGGDECSMHAVWLRGDGEPVDYGTMSSMEADAHLAEVRALGPTEPRPGDHCAGMYCPLNGACPAFVHAAELVPVTSLTARRNPLVCGVKTIEDAAITVELLPLVKARVEALEKELRGFVKTEHAGRLVLPDGRTYGPTLVTRKGGVDGEGALELATALGATPEDIARLFKPSATHERWSVAGKKRTE